ncbi:MAG: hypothetical protein ACRDVE_15700 [Actinocrinis sp.]
MLVSRLPMGYRTAAAWGTAADGWSRPEQLLAGVFDAIQHLDWVFRAAWREPNTTAPDKPKPLPRPGIADEAEATIDQRRAAFHARFQSLRR